MEQLTDELKETIIREHPNGIWIVLAEENAPCIGTAHDPLHGKGARIIPSPSPTS